MTEPRKTAVITGATSGLGRATAIALAAKGHPVLLLARSETAGQTLARSLCHRHGADHAKFLRVDLAEPGQVRATANAIKAEYPTIAILINNAGARNDRFLTASNGHELTFACNHLGHFLLTCLLLDRLIAAPTARVITVSSGNHGTAPTDGRWEQPRENYDRRQAYARSKMANIVFASELAHRLRETRTTSNIYEPGGVASGFARNNGLSSWLRHLVSHLLKRDLATPATAARGLVGLAAATNWQSENGRYFRRHQNLAALNSFHTGNVSADLWSTSVQMTNLNQHDTGTAWPLLKP